MTQHSSTARVQARADGRRAAGGPRRRGAPGRRCRAGAVGCAVGSCTWGWREPATGCGSGWC